MNQPAPDIEGLQYVEHLGTGGYSDVYLYERMRPRMRVAVKVLKDGRLAESEREQFAAEAETMAELADHPYIVQVFSTGALDDGRPYLVMKYYPPPNLGVRAAHDRLSVPDALRTGIKIASAVETAHRAGILHRDIKPANILVSPYGEPGLTDFGIAGHAAEAARGDDVGVSIPWSPREILNGSSNGSAQSDVYSLAATLWNLLVGRSPFELPAGDNSPRALMGRILRSTAPPTGRADVPPSLERLLSQGMSHDARSRPKSALEFARALQAVEQERRFARTEIVVDGLTPVRRPDAGRRTTDTTDGTRLRAPGRVDAAQPTPAPPPTTNRPIVASAPAPARRRVAPPAASSDSTVRRPTAPVSEPPASAPAAPSRRGLRRPQLGLIAAAVIVAAIAIAVVLNVSGGSGGKPTKDPSVTTVEHQVPPPGQPVVVAAADRAQHTIVFTWTYQSVRPGDTFEVASDVGQPPTEISTARYVVPVTGTHQACLVVTVARADGTTGSLTSKRVCDHL